VFEHRTQAHGMESVIIVDPTSNQGKNASMSCFKIRDVLALFRRIWDRLSATKSLVASKCEALNALKVKTEGADPLTGPSLDEASAAEVLASVGMGTDFPGSGSHHKERRFLEGIMELVEFGTDLHTLDSQ